MGKSAIPRARQDTKVEPESRVQVQDSVNDDHPLCEVIGTHEGEAWEEIRKSIKRNRRKADRSYQTSE